MNVKVILISSAGLFRLCYFALKDTFLLYFNDRISAFSYRGDRLWEFAPSLNTIFSVGDLNGDNQMEIVIPEYSNILILDSSGNLIDKIDLNGEGSISFISVVLGDVNKDSKKEIIATSIRENIFFK